MNYIRPAALALSAVILTGCGSRFSADNPTVTVPATAQTSSAVTETTSETVTTAEPTTAPVPPAELDIKVKNTLEVYDEVKLSDFVTSANVELAEPDTLVDTSELGENKAVIKYRSGGNIFETEAAYKVVDTTAPVVLNSGWAADHIAGTAFDLNEYVGFADNYDRRPTLSYTGNIDPNTVGSYPLHVTVTDNSGNSESWDMTVRVVSEIQQQTDNNPRVDFSTFISKYAGTGRRFGIDVSTWQGDIDFNAVRDAGCSFVVIRMGYYYDNITMDKYYQSNFQKAKEAGLDVGVYFYTTDHTEEGVRERADWIAEQLGGAELELPVAFDWEEFGNFQQYGMSIHDLNEYYLAFSDQMKKHGYSTMLYSSKNFLNNFWSESTKAATPVWLAHFVDETDYNGEYAIWQASCYGKIPGIYGDVDMNILYQPLPLE